MHRVTLSPVRVTTGDVRAFPPAPGLVDVITQPPRYRPEAVPRVPASGSRQPAPAAGPGQA
jgi:hypothetical protein